MIKFHLGLEVVRVDGGNGRNVAVLKLGTRANPTPSVGTALENLLVPKQEGRVPLLHYRCEHL